MDDTVLAYADDKSPHMLTQLYLEAEIGAIPVEDPNFYFSDKPEAGMFVLRAASFEEAAAIADDDPLHKAGVRTYTLQKWRVNEGSITITVNYSDQTAKIV